MQCKPLLQITDNEAVCLYVCVCFLDQIVCIFQMSMTIMYYLQINLFFRAIYDFEKFCYFLIMKYFKHQRKQKISKMSMYSPP